MSETLEKYELEYDLEGSGLYKLHEFYLAADVEAILDDPQALAAHLIKRQEDKP